MSMKYPSTRRDDTVDDYHGRSIADPYPATLVCTADFDDRVVPSHSFKFRAALQRAQGCASEDRPVLIRIETHRSHGYRPTDKRIAELADQWAFAAAHAGVTTVAVPESGSRPDR